MSRYIVKGGKKLEGTVRISGSKNAALPIIAATILNRGKTTLYNVPNISDTQMMYEILKSLGAKVTKKNNKVIIDTSGVDKYEIPHNLMRQMRSSVIIAGSLIGKYKKCIFSYPGGCDIGSRPIDLHLKSFEKLGIKINQNYGNIECFCDIINGERIDLEFPSVGATENIMLASVLERGVTIITNAAKEPEIVDLQNFLNKMGADIQGAGTDTICIQGVSRLKDLSYTIMPDRIEAGTFLCMGAATGGNVVLENIEKTYLIPIISKLQETDCKIKIYSNNIEIKGPKRLKPVDIKTMPYPGFPTDMQSVMATSLVKASGTSIINENIFENRYKYMQELNRMGAKISVEGKIAIIKGVKQLKAAEVNATDLRGGAALVTAALCAKGTSKINKIEYILRGYDMMEEKLQNLGATIRID